MGRRTARRFEPFLAHVADVIRTAVPVKHLDETGLRIAARTRWLHVLCTPFLTVLRIGAGRGDVEKDLEGILIHDDYAACFTLKGVRHGACNAHHLRELQALIDIEKEDWAKSMHRLLERAHRATRFSRENGRDAPASLVARISRAWARILDHAIAFHEAQPPLRNRQARTKETPPSVITSRSASASTRRDACDSSPTRARRLRTMRPNVTSEWPSCARRSPVASAPRGVPTTSPECVPSSPPPESKAGTSSTPWCIPIRCN